MVSHYMVPGASEFCERGGRFGAHSSNESFAPIYNKKLAFIAWFNAGVRAIDIRDPFNPKEVAPSSRRSRTRPTGAASRSARNNVARSPSRPTTWRPTTAATSISSTAPHGHARDEVTGEARNLEAPRAVAGTSSERRPETTGSTVETQR
jgi:hypothetical protein